MKLRLSLLTLSLAFSAALVEMFLLRPSLAAPEFREFFSRNSAPNPPAPPKKTPPPVPAIADHQLWSALHTSDIPTLIRRLREAGFPPAMARAVVTAAVNAEFAPRFDALFAPAEAAPYWKPDPVALPAANASGLLDRSNQLYRERTKRLRDVLADDFFARAPTAEERRNIGDLPPAKIAAIRRINDDYAAMNTQVSAAMNGITLPEDREKLALLEREKRADLAAALTPAELFEYDRHAAPALVSLQFTLTLMNATEEEFNTIFRLRFAVEAAQKTTVTIGDIAAARAAANLQLDQDIRAALGDQRYTDYARASDREFQSLTRLAQRENLPTDTTVRAFSLRDSVAAESNRIVGDAVLSANQKRVALQSLAQDTRTRLQALLGPTTGAAYVQVVNRNWLNTVEQGYAVTFAPSNVIDFKRVSAP